MHPRRTRNWSHISASLHQCKRYINRWHWKLKFTMGMIVKTKLDQLQLSVIHGFLHFLASLRTNDGRSYPFQNYNIGLLGRTSELRNHHQSRRVGSYARGMFLVHSQCLETKYSYIASRPIRVNVKHPSYDWGLNYHRLPRYQFSWA
uniref:3-dehydroquinate synthase C-terminal domain-containing protein n=2 Tax=Oryza punctata TaxID=4537 RepID=A0A0E0K9B8_ORYPU